jgi:serine/threonine protein phosphatase PrpC
VRLAGAITQGSGSHNEDAYGFAGTPDNVTAAWVFDGVTGINAQTLLGVPSEPAWFVECAQRHLRELVTMPGDVLDVLQALVPRLMADWAKATQELHLPTDYDMPAACLILVKRVADTWQVLRLGDSYVLSQADSLTNHPHPPSDLPDLEAELRLAVQAMRRSGEVDQQALRDRFRARMQANRRGRNKPGSYGVLVPDMTALAVPELFTLDAPTDILLCSDGFYRAVDTYGLMDDAGLMHEAKAHDGVEAILNAIRKTEGADPSCEKHPRFKPADDATAVMLREG